MEELNLIMNDDGVFVAYDDRYDITIHCESEEEQKEVFDLLCKAGIFSSESEEA